MQYVIHCREFLLLQQLSLQATYNDSWSGSCSLAGTDITIKQCVDAAALYLLLGRPMLPPGEGWALFLLWVCAHIGGFTANKVNLPPLLGMLIAGIILRNIPQGDSVVLEALVLPHTYTSTASPTPCKT